MICFIFPWVEEMKNVLLKKNWILQVAVRVDGYRHFPISWVAFIYFLISLLHPHLSVTGLQYSWDKYFYSSPIYGFKKQVSLALCHCFSLPWWWERELSSVRQLLLGLPSPHHLCLETQEFYSALRVLLINSRREILCISYIEMRSIIKQQCQ